MSHAFYERGSWYHRTKILREDYSVIYGKVGGFQSDVEAEKDYEKHIKEFNQNLSSKLTIQGTDISLREYLIYWYQSIFSERIVSTTEYLSAYVLYTFLLPSIDGDVKLRTVSSEYLDEVLKRASRYCESAGNKSRELLNLALKDAVVQGYIQNNPVPSTKPYKRKKPTVIVLNKEEIRLFLEKASENNWYLEILLGLFMGLRKGEIAGLKYGDFDLSRNTVTISRQITSNPIVPKGQGKISEYQIIEKPPKTPNSHRTLRVPEEIMEEVMIRKAQNDFRKERLGDAYIDKGYLSCSENGLPHAASSFNMALTKLCRRCGLPHLTVHSLRHMYASILTEQGVPLIKVSALLGHSSMNTTFEYYCEVMDETENIRSFLNNNFLPEGA